MKLKQLQVNAGYFLATYKIINEVHLCRGFHTICCCPPPLSFSILIGFLIYPHQSNLICFCCVGHCSLPIHSLSLIGSKTLLCTSSLWMRLHTSAGNWVDYDFLYIFDYLLVVQPIRMYRNEIHSQLKYFSSIFSSFLFYYGINGASATHRKLITVSLTLFLSSIEIVKNQLKIWAHHWKYVVNQIECVAFCCCLLHPPKWAC